MQAFSPRGLFSRALVPLVAAGLAATTCSVPDLSVNDPPKPLAQNTIIYAADGTRITTLHAEENRVLVPIERIPKVVQEAVVAIEDKRFWTHRGIDLKALLRATYVNATEGRVVEGGSTITQQYVKNTLVGRERTLKRKVREAALAWDLEREHSKREILGGYLNTIYFGRGAYGIQAAARKFFSRAVWRLTLPQSALLAGLIAAPERYDPVDVPELALARRNRVLRRMRELRMIERTEYEQALAAPLGLRLAPERGRYAAPYFVEYVKERILHDRRFGETEQERYDLLFKGGLRIHTTIDLELQRAAEEAVRGVLSQPGDPYGALTAIDPQTGHVKAMVGGRDFFARPETDSVAQVNLATGDGGTGRQAGSSFKPFALVAALENGISPQKTYPAGSSITIPVGDGPPWQVENYEGSAFGEITLEDATIDSVNVVYAQLIMEVGPETVVETAHGMGIRSRLRSFPSAVLGTNEVNTLEMASAYGTLAANGVHAEPAAIERITDASGRTVYEAEPFVDDIINPGVAWVANEILRKVILYGTGVAANIGRPAAGKTGTAQEWRDGWFVGYVPQLVAAVWVGFPQGQIPMVPPRTRIRVTGGSFPAQIWRAFMDVATEGMPMAEFEKPVSSFVTLPIDVERGCVAVGTTPAEDVEARTFVVGTQPERCPAPIVGGVPVGAGVPAVVGMPVVAAVQLLEQVGLSSVQTTEYHPNYPPGTVIRQTPSAGSPVPPDGSITLAVATRDSPVTSVPRLVGLPEQEAVARLDAAGLAVGIVQTAAPNPAYAPGAVVAQSPKAGVEVFRGSTVTITINPAATPSPVPSPSPT